ncbi:MAG: hypothetical protein OER92_07995 [Alphaproteobacteria bacterium]|nr:hypothetical protein [Alphaproteobacteria bacterium]
MADREAELTCKLVDTFHLSALERAELPGGRVRGSVLVRAIAEGLANVGWFPKDWRPDQPFDGLLIEARVHAYIVHARTEIGAAQYSEVRSEPEKSLEDAIRTVIATNFGDDIDGVPVDWST